MIGLFKKKPKAKKELFKITHRSNVVQYDEMGYPLRLVIINNKEHIWVDSCDQEGDVVLKWEEVIR